MGYKLIWESKGVTKQFFGDITGQDLLLSVQAVEANERFDHINWVINDFLSIDTLCLDTMDAHLIDEIAAIDKAAAITNPNIRIAILTTNKNMIEIADRYANSDMNVYPTRVFSGHREARLWLSLPI